MPTLYNIEYGTWENMQKPCNNYLQWYSQAFSDVKANSQMTHW